MEVVLIIISAGLLGLIIYFAVSPKSSRVLRLAALLALALIALSIGVCSVFLIKGPGEEPEPVPPFMVVEETEPEAKKSNLPAVIGFLVVFLFILSLITVIALRKQKKKDAPQKKVPVSRADSGVPMLEDDEESFDIDFN